MGSLGKPGKGKAPRIVRMELVPILVPFNDAVKEVMQSGAGGLGMAIPAEEAWEGAEFVVCKLVAEDGHVGLGEAFVWLPETGVSPAQVIDSADPSRWEDHFQEGGPLAFLNTVGMKGVRKWPYP